MGRTRASARLAEAVKAKPPDEQVDLGLSSEADVGMSNAKEQNAQDSDFEVTKQEEKEEDDDDDFEEVAPSPPKRKRAKTAKSKTTAAPRKRQVRGKQGRLADLMKMPIDVFTEIALHLMPKDIISLSRLNKFFHSLLMRRSALHIWHGAMHNVPDLPPCPPDMIEPHYLALIYARNCMSCGAMVNRRMDLILRTRLCKKCTESVVVGFNRVPGELTEFLLWSGTIVSGKRSMGGNVHTFVSDVEHIATKLEEFKELSDPEPLQAWKDEQKKKIKTRHEQARELFVFLDKIDRGRWHELKDMKTQHHESVKNRLLEEGWENKDLVFRYPDTRGWRALVEQPKVLTDRTWANLKPKLLPLLEANRAERLKREAAARTQERRESLAETLEGIKHEGVPIIDATIRRPATTSGSPWDPTTSSVRHMGIFPDIVDGLEWEILKNLLEEDLSVAEMNERVKMVRPEIGSEAFDWIEDVEAKLVELLRQGRTNKGLSLDIPSPVLPLAEESADDPLERATEHQKILLRADSLFRSTRSGMAMSYDEMVKDGYTAPKFGYYSYSRTPRSPLDASKFQRHDVGQAQACKILGSMGKPNATFLEMKSVGKAYCCGRCPDETVFTWDNLIDHFVGKVNEWSMVENNQAELAKQNLTLRDVHSLEWETDKPLVRILSPTEVAHMQANPESIKTCLLCQRAAVGVSARGKEENMKEHIKDVHGISEPVPVEHYRPYTLNIFGSLLSDHFIHDVEDDSWDEGYDSYDDVFFPFW